MYPYHVSEEEHLALQRDPCGVQKAFEQAITADLAAWVEFADSRLAGTEVIAYVMPGNDDPEVVDEALKRGQHVLMCDERVIRVGAHELLSFGWSNITPWKSPRELEEDQLYLRLRKLADQLETPQSAIFNIHVPPRASGLDTAFEVDESLAYVRKGGQPHEVPVGSSAVRQIIEEFQPALTLHGHVHESKGMMRIGRSWVVNPGSDYTTGRLEGCLIHLDGPAVRVRHLVRG
jgi:Icc-related predicted phosphoesterase